MKHTNIKTLVVRTPAAHDKNKSAEPVVLLNAAGAAFSGADLDYAPITTATAIATAAKTTTSPEPKANSIVPIKFTNGNSAASPTVAFNGGTARSILLGGTAPAAIECTLAANGVALFWFDGTALHQLGVYS